MFAGFKMAVFNRWEVRVSFAGVECCYSTWQLGLVLIKALIQVQVQNEYLTLIIELIA